MALKSRQASRARLEPGCHCERPIPHREYVGEIRCVKCGHDMDRPASTPPPARSGRHNGRQR